MCFDFPFHNEKAYRDLLEALRIDPTVAKFYYSLGLALEHLNHLEDAQDSFLAALELQPDHVIIFRLFDCYIEKKKKKRKKTH